MDVVSGCGDGWRNRCGDLGEELILDSRWLLKVGFVNLVWFRGKAWMWLTFFNTSCQIYSAQ